MSPVRLAVILFLAALAVIVLAYYFISVTTKRRKINSDTTFVKKNRRFLFYNDFFLTRAKFRKLYGQVTNLSVYTFMEGRLITVAFYEKTMLLSIIMLVAAFLAFQDILSGVLIFLIVNVFIDISLYRQIDKVNLAVEAQLIHALTSLAKTYTRCNNIPDALHEAEVGSLIRRSFHELYEIVTATNGKEKLNSFYRTMPNRTLRTLATACWVLHDIGDASVFVSTRSINAVSLTIQMLKGDLTIGRSTHLQQSLMFSKLPQVALYPLAAYPILQFILTLIFPAVGVAFSGIVGYVGKCVMLIVSFVCYYALSTMGASSVARVDDRIHVVRELMKHEKIQRFAEFLQTSNLKRRRILQGRINHSLSSKNLPYLYLERFTLAAVSSLAAIAASIVIVSASRTAIYENVRTISMMSSTNYTMEEMGRLRAFDAGVLAMEAVPDSETLTKGLKAALPKLTATQLDEQSLRLGDKYKSYHNTHFYWWFAFIYIAAAAIGYHVPLMLLRLRAKVITAEAQLDVLQLQTVVAILSTTQLDTMDVVYWMSKSSDVHRDVLTTCYHSYAMNPQKAIYDLRRSSAVPEFSAMCDDLLSTVYQVSLEDAFSSLVTDRESALEERKIVEEFSLKSRRNAASGFATAPMFTWVVVGLLLPLGAIVVSSFSSVMNDLGL